MGTSVVPPAGNGGGTHPCPVPNDLQKKVDELQDLSNKQDLNDAKLQLAEAKQINGEVDKAEASYKQDYDTLKFSLTQFQQYAQNRGTQIDSNVSDADKKIIDGIVSCVSTQIDYLEQQWKDARPKVRDAQSKLFDAKIARKEAEDPYRAALDYKSNSKDLDSLQTSSTKLIDAKDFRGAYFLVEDEMANGLKQALPAPTDFNSNLEKLALAFFYALDAERTAQAAFDQATADLQLKKKKYDDATKARRDNILAQIASQTFTQPANQPAAPLAAAAAAAQAGTGTAPTNPQGAARSS